MMRAVSEESEQGYTDPTESATMRSESNAIGYSGMPADLCAPAPEPFPLLTWPALPDLPELSGPTISVAGRRFFARTPSTILKLGIEEGEALMTSLAHDIPGGVVPGINAVVTITGPPLERGLLMTRQPGTTLAELWPDLCQTKRAVVKDSLVQLLVDMRTRKKGLNYYGRPGRAYVLPSEFGQLEPHAFCRTRLEWNESRTAALRCVAEVIGASRHRVQALKRIQSGTTAGGSVLVDAAVLNHGDLADRNILVEPSACKVTGLIDWEQANVAPAYFEYVTARLCEGHEASWRKTLLEVLRDVLRIECERAAAAHDDTDHSDRAAGEAGEAARLLEETLLAWNAFVDVERSAQGFSDDCAWTFEDVSSVISNPDRHD